MSRLLETLNVNIDRTTTSLLNLTSVHAGEVPGASTLVYRRVFSHGGRRAFAVSRREGKADVGLKPYAELVLRDVVDTCRSTSPNDTKLERIKQTMRLAGF
jgi:hypothetical protein